MRSTALLVVGVFFGINAPPARADVPVDDLGEITGRLVLTVVNADPGAFEYAACSLPVYASQPGSPRNHATLGSRPVASLCRTGLFG